MLILIDVPLYISIIQCRIQSPNDPCHYSVCRCAGGDSQLHNIPTEYCWVFQELIVSSADELFQDKNCHHRVFGLNGSKTISNLSADADRPLAKTVIFQTLFATGQSWRRRGQNLLWVKTDCTALAEQSRLNKRKCVFPRQSFVV